ncbi:winged helix-turn-helix domain-containing protein [Pleurocapsa sp. PCC 7319]|uniref:winged helix-turn-helix domain-containing protein n=1 Tax=Pleurocapsa sp. PCC 7319 TaxID=118161 RepID=UPI0003449341|nr:winged helix-turn-helix domain-containing protein [Pleurocapsa sp. PCC 7319]
MPSSLKLKSHLSLEELKQRYRNSCDSVERSHYQIIWLLASGKTVAEVSSITNYSTKWIYKLASRYNHLGEEGLGDRRHQNQGNKPLLDDVQLAHLWQRLQTPPVDGGLWNSRKVADWMSELLERPVSKQRGWEYLRGYELRLKQPRPAHTESDPFEQEKWKKTSKQISKTMPR